MIIIVNIQILLNTGDDRNTEVPTLAVLHTIFLREHNRLVKQLQLINPHWSDETLYQEGRTIIAALLQHITYSEYLPHAVGPMHMEKYGLWSTPLDHNTVYDPSVDATVKNAFGVAAFRFGHSQIPNFQMQMNSKFKVVQ